MPGAFRSSETILPCEKPTKARTNASARPGDTSDRVEFRVIWRHRRAQRHGQFSTRRLPFRLAENVFADLDRPTIERLGLVILALGLKVVVPNRNVGIILAESLLFNDLDRPTIERLGLVILALGLKQTGEVVVTPSNVGMVLAAAGMRPLVENNARLAAGQSARNLPATRS